MASTYTDCQTLVKTENILGLNIKIFEIYFYKSLLKNQTIRFININKNFCF